MKQVYKIFQFEFLEKLKTKSFLIAWILMVVLSVVMVIAPSVISKLQFNPNNFSKTNNKQIAIIGTIDQTLQTALKDYDVLYSNLEQAEQAYRDGDVSVVVVYESPEHIQMYGEDSHLQQIFERNYIEQVKTKELGISVEDYLAIQNARMQVDYLSFDDAPSTVLDKIFITMAVVFLLYFISIVIGAGLGVNIVREKESRTMELLITNAKASHLIIGKVLASILIGLLQSCSIVLAVFIAYQVNRMLTPDAADIVQFILKGVGLFEISIFLLYILLGTAIYYFMFAALGSLVSKIEEYNSASSPSLIVIVVGFILSQSFVTNPDSVVLKVASYIPLISPFPSITRFGMGTLSGVELLINILFTLLTVCVVTWIAIKIYRFGSLNYGRKFKLKNIFKS